MFCNIISLVATSFSFLEMVRRCSCCCGMCEVIKGNSWCNPKLPIRYELYVYTCAGMTTAHFVSIPSGGGLVGGGGGGGGWTIA